MIPSKAGSVDLCKSTGIIALSCLSNSKLTQDFLVLPHFVLLLLPCTHVCRRRMLGYNCWDIPHI